MENYDRDTIYQAILRPEVLRSFRQEQLWKLIKALSEERKIRYSRRRRRKYGNINKGFSPSELRAFFTTPMQPTARMAFLTMLLLGLRIGEVVSIRRQDIDLAGRRLYVRTEKTGTNDSIYLHDAILEPLAEWMEEYATSIQEHDGYVFFAGKGRNPHQWISPNYLRNEFRRVCIAADIDRVYAESDERQGRATRRLHLRTTHSFRHTFATVLYRKSKNLLLVSKALRHSDMKSTTAYLHADQSELDHMLSSFVVEM